MRQWWRCWIFRGAIACEIARQAGAAAVLGKPWLNVDLVMTLQYAVEHSNVENLRPTSFAA